MRRCWFEVAPDCPAREGGGLQGVLVVRSSLIRGGLFITVGRSMSGRFLVSVTPRDLAEVNQKQTCLAPTQLAAWVRSGRCMNLFHP